MFDLRYHVASLAAVSFCASAQDSAITRNPWLALPNGGSAGDRINPKSSLSRMRNVSGSPLTGIRTETC